MNFVPLLLSGLISIGAANPDLQDFINANNLFASALHKQVAKRNHGNFLVSSLSVQALLSLVRSGSKGPTEEELTRILHLRRDDTVIKKIFVQLKGSSYCLNTASKIYIKKNLPIKADFQRLALEAYDSETESVDFSNSADAASKINSWVERKTADKIRNVIEASQINRKTKGVLINALHFNASWNLQFPPILTKEANFYKLKGNVVQTDTMFLEEAQLPYRNSSDLKAQFLELAFKGEDAKMTIVLPHEIDGLDSLEDNIEKAFAIRDLTEEFVSVSMPKFRFETRSDLKKSLKTLGVTKIFDGDQADLSGIAGERGDLVVSKLLQKTFVDVNEEGVEAAAATYIPEIVPSMGSVDTAKLVAVDRPFVFYIRVKGIILFTGRVVSPTH